MVGGGGWGVGIFFFWGFVFFCLGFGIGCLTHVRLLDVDDFIAELWKVHLAVKEEGYVQVDSLESPPRSHRHRF